MGFKRDSFYLFSLNAVALVAGLGTSIVVARLLGPEGKGVLYLLILVPQFATSLGGLGVRAGAVYFAGKGRSHVQLLRLVAGTGLVLAALYLAAGFGLRDVLAGSILKGLDGHWILLALGLIPIYLLWSYGDGLLQGMRQFGAYSILHACAITAKFVALVVVIWFFGKDLTWAVWIYAAAAALPATVSWWLARSRATATGETTAAGELLRYGLAGHLGTIAQRANLRLDVFVLNAYVGPAGIGVYSIATLLAELIWKIPDSVSQALLPRVAAAEAAEADTMTRLVCRNALLITAATAIVLASICTFIIRFVYGADFLGAVPALLWLLPGVLALGVSKVLTKYLSGMGKPGLNSVASVVSLAFNLPALFLLVPRLGIAGAALATSIAYVVHAAVVLFFFTRETGKRPGSALIPRRSDFGLYKDMARTLWTAAQKRMSRANGSME